MDYLVPELKGSESPTGLCFVVLHLSVMLSPTSFILSSLSHMPNYHFALLLIFFFSLLVSNSYLIYLFRCKIFLVYVSLSNFDQTFKKKKFVIWETCVKIVGNCSLLYFCFVALCHIFATFRLWGQLYREKKYIK